MMNYLNTQTPPLELLPPDVVGAILDQLNKVTGSKGIINKADIPIVLKYAGNLACISKTMAYKVNHLLAVEVFLNSLSNKYGSSQEHFAALLNSRGTRKWLWKYIEKNEDDKAYQVIQAIYELATEVLLEAKSAKLEFKFSLGRDGWPTPNPYYYQTKQGFFLYNDWNPSHLATPFGEVKIYGGGVSSANSPLSVAEVFIKRLKGTFEGLSNSGSGFDKGEIFEITSSKSTAIRKISHELMKSLSESELEKKKGSQNLIVNSLCGHYGIYKIKEVKGLKVPEAMWYDSKQPRRSYELINRIWEMLEAKKLNLDPIAKQIKDKEIYKKPIDVEKSCFKNIIEVSQWGIDLLIKLEQEPIYRVESWFSTPPTKLLALKDYSEARTLQILNSAAEGFLDKTAQLSIHTFGGGNNRRYLNDKDLGIGIELTIDEGKLCDVDTLKFAYDMVINNVSKNWEISRLEDHPTILHTQSEEEYILLVKKEKIVAEEDTLIRCLADKLGLSNTIQCQSEWKDKSSTGIYLWIKKNNLEEALSALNIIVQK